MLLDIIDSLLQLFESLKWRKGTWRIIKTRDRYIGESRFQVELITLIAQVIQLLNYSGALAGLAGNDNLQITDSD